VPEWAELVMSLIGLTANQIGDCEQNSSSPSSSRLIAQYQPLSLLPKSMQTKPGNLARATVACVYLHFTARRYIHRQIYTSVSALSTTQQQKSET